MHALFPRLVAPGLAALCLAGCASTISTDQARQEVQSTMHQAKSHNMESGGVTMKGGELHGDDDLGHRLWSVRAGEIRTNVGEGKTENQDATFVNGHATLYHDGAPQTYLFAPLVTLTSAATGPQLVMTGGVRGQTTGDWSAKRGPVTMQTPEADIDIKARRLKATKGVAMQQGTAHVTGNVLNADSGLADATLTGAVRGVDTQGTMTADAATWHWKTGQVQATGHVVAVHTDTTVTGPHLAADTNLARGSLTGGVDAKSGQGAAHAQTVNYDWRKGQIVALGGVVLHKDEAVLTARRVDTDSKLDDARATGGVTLVKGDTTLSADRGQATQHMTSATADGNVCVTRADGVITGDHATATGLGKGGKPVVQASGNVFAKNPQGAVRAGFLTWGGGEVVATQNVTLYKDGNQLNGARLVCDDKFQQAVWTGPVQGKLARGGTVSGTSVVWHRNGGVEAHHGVTAVRDDLHLRADNLDASADGATMVLTGHVVVTNTQGATMTAPRVRYDRKAGRVYGEGGVDYKDPARGLVQHGQTLVSNLQLHEATLTGVAGTGSQTIFKNKKLF